MKRILIILLCFLMLVGCGCKKKKNKETKQEDNIKYQANFDLSKEITVDGLKISSVQVVKDENGKSNYTSSITNETESIYKLKQVNIKIKNKKEKEITTLIVYVGTDLMPGESRTLTTSTDIDLMKGYTISYEIKK